MKPGDLEKAVKFLKQGRVVAYPTDTAYGLAVDATNEKAVERLYRLKGRNFNKPTHVIIPTAVWLNKIVILSKPALVLMNKFMPGPITIILPLKAKGKSWEKLSAKAGTMGIRIPKNSTAQMLVEALKKPITATSANVSGMPNCYSVEEIRAQFAKTPRKPDFYLDAGKLKKSKPSTVVLIEKNRVKILRLGPITERQIKNVFSKTSKLFFS